MVHWGMRICGLYVAARGLKNISDVLKRSLIFALKKRFRFVLGEFFNFVFVLNVAVFKTIKIFFVKS